LSSAILARFLSRSIHVISGPYRQYGYNFRGMCSWQEITGFDKTDFYELISIYHRFLWTFNAFDYSNLSGKCAFLSKPLISKPPILIATVTIPLILFSKNNQAESPQNSPSHPTNTPVSRPWLYDLTPPAKPFGFRFFLKSEAKKPILAVVLSFILLTLAKRGLCNE
jgi:hypothetical protein